VAKGSEDVILKGSAIEVCLAGTGGAAESAEIDRQNAKPHGYQSSGLRPPTLLVESSAVSKDNAAGPLAVEIGAESAESAMVFGGERDRSLCGNERGHCQDERPCVHDAHHGMG
jgi:hypothetical protein